MRNEPEIVKILRKEEQSKFFQIKSLTNYNDIQTTEDTSIDVSQKTITTVKTDNKQHLDNPNIDFFETIYKTVLEEAMVAFLVADTRQRIISWNTYAETLLGKTNFELFLKSIQPLLTNDILENKSKSNKQPQIPHHITTKILTKYNEAIDVDILQCILKNNEEENLGTIYIIKNISEPKLVQHQLGSIIDYADDAIYVLDSSYRYIIANNKLLSQLGFSREEVIGKTYNEFHTFQETQDFIQKVNWVFENRKPLEDIQNKNGKYFLRTLSPVKDYINDRTTAVLVVIKDITEIKKAENLLTKNETKYRTIFEFFPQMVLLIDRTGIILDINEHIKDWLGYKPDEILQTNLFSAPFLTKKSKNTINKRLSHYSSKKSVPSYEIEMLTKSGKKQTGIIYTTRIQDDQEEIIATIIAVLNTTKRKKRKEAEKIKGSAISSSINAFALTNLKGNITYVNKAFLRMWGYCKEKEILGKPIIQFLKMKDNYFGIIDIIKITGEWIGELTGIRKDYSTFQVQLSANIIKDKSSKPICVMACFVDLTKYNKEAKSLDQSENKYQEILEKSFGMRYELDLKKQLYNYISGSSENILGYNSTEMLSFTLKQMKELIHPEDSDRWNNHLKKSNTGQNKGDAIHTIEYRIKHKLFGYRWVSDTYSTRFDKKNEPIAVIGIIKDITEQKKIWIELVKSEEKYRILAETSADGVFTTDSLARLTYINPAFEKLCGHKKNKIINTPFRNYLFEDSIYYFQQIFIDTQKKNEKIENVYLELLTDDGCITPIEANIAPLKKETEFGGIVCTVRDIKQRQEIESELKKNERLKTEFMNIAAHELRSPVTPIKGYLDLIIHDAESNEKIKNWAKISLRNTERLLKLVNDILDVSRLDSDTMRFNMEKINPVELLNEIVDDMRISILNKNLEFRVNMPKALPQIIGDKNRLSQVLKNLIGNSIKFTDSGFISLDVEKENDYLLIAIEDTGIGISKEELKKIFIKFYQAYTGEDRNNEGTGLGLFISKEIVKKHNGTILAESKIGKGSRFVIQLPHIHKIGNN